MPFRSRDKFRVMTFGCVAYTLIIDCSIQNTDTNTQDGIKSGKLSDVLRRGALITLAEVRSAFMLLSSSMPDMSAWYAQVGHLLSILREYTACFS